MAVNPDLASPSSHKLASNPFGNMTLCVGRDEELGLIAGRLIRVNDTYFEGAKSLHFLGGPKIGKTTLLEQAREDICSASRGQEAHWCPVFVSWRETPHGLEWGDGVLSQIDTFFQKTAIRQPVAKVIHEHWNDTADDLPTFFRDIEAICVDEPPAKLRIIFLLDDFDYGLRVVDTEREVKGLISAPDFIAFAEQWPRTVKLIATSHKYLKPQYSRPFEEGRWLSLLGRSDAYELAGERLEGASAEILDPVIEWAGYHPYYITNLCEAVRATAAPDRWISKSIVNRAINWWKVNPEIEDHLAGFWEYLDLAEEVRRIIVLRRVLKGDTLEKSLSPHLEDALCFLEDRAVIAVSKNNGGRTVSVPARLLRDFMRASLSVPPEEPRWGMTEMHFIRSFYAAMLLSFLTVFLLYVADKPIGWGLAWFVILALYVCGWSLFKLSGAARSKKNP